MSARILIILQNTDTEVLQVEELMVAQAQLQTIDAGYQDLKLETPEWVIDKLQEVATEIKLRVQSELARRLKVAKARRSNLRTADEKRRDLDLEIAELEKALS